MKIETITIKLSSKSYRYADLKTVRTLIMEALDAIELDAKNSGPAGVDFQIDHEYGEENLREITPEIEAAILLRAEDVEIGDLMNVFLEDEREFFRNRASDSNIADLLAGRPAN